MGDPAEIEALHVESEVVGVEAARCVDISDGQIRDDFCRFHTCS